MKTSRIHFQRGQSTVELMVAIFVFTVAMAGIAAVIFGNQFMSLDGEMNNIGVAKAQDLLEQQRANGKNNFYGVVAGVTTDGPYTKTVTVNDLNQCQKEVTSKIAWSTGQGAPKQVTLTTLINNLAEELANGGQCSGINANNSALTCPNSTEIVSISSDTVTGIAANPTGLKVSGSTVYLSATPLSPGDTVSSDFWVLDVNSSYQYSINTLKTFSTGSGGLNALDIAGNYAYAASVNGSKQLQIIQLNTNPPSVVGYLALPGNTQPGLSIDYRSGKVYIGTAASAGPEFFIIDVSNPAHPSLVEKGVYEVGGDVREINVIGSAAYLATSNSAKQIVQLDVLNAALISEAAVSNPSGSVGGQSLYFLGSRLFTGSNFGSNPNLSILNLANFANIGSAFLPTLSANVNNTGQPNSLLATGNMLFVGTSLGADSKSKFMAINVSSPSNPVFCSAPTATKSFSSPVVDMEFQDGFVYLLLKNNFPLKIIKLNY
jgi:hypothetical protein